MNKKELLSRKKHSFIDCDYCKNWEERHRYFKTCPRCSNSKKTIDPKEILCNMCGETMCPLGKMNYQEPHGLYLASVIGGYDSYHLFDLTAYVFNFCEKCLRQMFMQCKIKPDLYEVDALDNGLARDEKWEDDQIAYEYREWETNGGKHQAYLSGKCNVIKECPNKAVYTKLNYDEFTEDCTCEEHKTSYGKYVPFISDKLKPFL